MNKCLRFLKVALGLVSIASVSFLHAQERQRPYTINLKNQIITAPENATQWFDSMSNVHYNRPVRAIIQFRHLPDQQERQQLKSLGIELSEYLPNYSFISVIHFPPANSAFDKSNMRSVLPMQTEWKISDRLSKELKTSKRNQVKILVSFEKGTSLGAIEETVAKAGGQITDRKFAAINTYEVQLPGAAVLPFAGNAFIKYVTLPAQNIPLNYDARASSGATYLSSLAANGLFELEGEGVTVGMGDNTSGIYHVDVRDRIINFNPAGPTMHGVHTTTTVAGKGIMDPKATGMAPSSRVLSHLFDLVWAETGPMYNGYNMTVTNNSYAAVVSDCDYAGTYDQYSNMLDEYGLQYPFVQHVFASGNDGLMQCPPYAQGFHTVTGGYQEAKNVLTVGGLAKDNTLWPKSARGPVNDGRIKPEIMAYGFGIVSGDVYDNYGNSNGTSMSCPVVTGNLALFEERYKQLHNNQNAPASLMKALAMNGATDVGNPGPDFTNGFGLINTYRSIQMLDNNHYLFDSVANAATNTHIISVPANTAQLKVMLYWADDAASPLAATALINDLDLTVKDPNNSNTHHPFVLDPTPANVNNNAVEGIDTRNNVEQVVIDHPVAGNYNVYVTGSNVPNLRKPYVIVYDFIPQGIKIKRPVAGVPIQADDTLRVYWDASDDPNPFTMEYSDNNGASWNTISNSIPATERQLKWGAPNISTTQALLRIRRNNTSQQDVTGAFVINPQVTVQFSAIQCPGYMAIEWNAIPGATAYQVLKKIGDDLRPIDTVTTTNYVLSGLSFDSTYFAAVCPLINGVPGWRSKAVKRQPFDGNCAGNISDGDLMIDSILSPRSGRLFTSSALTANDTVKVRIRNLDDVTATNYRVSYSINGGGWQSQTVTSSIAAGATANVSFGGLNLAGTGIYSVKVAVQNLAATDPVASNDTAIRFVRQLQNASVDIDNVFTDDFENAPRFTMLQDSMGIMPNDHWDYYNSTDSGRIRSFVSSDVLITGQRSISLDNFLYKEDNQNYLTGTFNLQNYDTSNTEARLEFDYKIHGHPKYLAGNEVWVRGSDTQAWQKIYTIDTTVIPGQVINTGSLSLTNILATSLQNFSSSFQVRIGQRDTSVIAMNEYGNGMTIDNFKLYSVKNDVQLLTIVSPEKFNCGADSFALTIKVYNSDNLPQDTVLLLYNFDNGALQTDTIFNLTPKDTVMHTFGKRHYAGIGTHTLNVWLSASGDTYLNNDSVLQYTFRNQPLITTFPYLENFEAGDGNWFTDGLNSSWQWGVPGANRITRAASGKKAWTTNLNGNYNDNELSYLYSPCFDLSGIASPMLSFSLNTDIEDCGNTLCDAAWVEYSADGVSWTKLGSSGEGYNWYGGFEVWSNTDSRWRVASMPLPPDIASLKLRFVFQSDPSASRNGIAVDDIHIFDKKFPVYEGNTATAAENTSGSNWMGFTADNALVTSIRVDGAANVLAPEVKTYKHGYLLNPLKNFYGLSRNFTVKGWEKLTDSATLRIYIPDAEVIQLVNDNGCDTCTRPADAYRLNIIKYDDADTAKENGSLADNVNGVYSFIPYTDIQWVPYDKGYYSEIRVDKLSEFWFGAYLPKMLSAVTFLYPNPVLNNQFHIVWNAAPGTSLELAVYDITGRVVYRSSAEATDYDNNSLIQLPPVEQGIYFVRYFYGQESATVKILVY
jgi:hypothetical protein